MGTLMTVKEARKLLGKNYSEMSDAEVQKLIDDLTMLARLSIEDSRAKLLQERHESELSKASISAPRSNNITL